MASLRRNRRKAWILRYSIDGNRDEIYLGQFDRVTADDIRRHCERILEARLAGTALATETAAWLGRIDRRLREKLEQKGLVEPAPDVGPTKLTLREFLRQYESQRAGDVCSLTRRNLEQTRKKLLAYFGPEKTLVSVAPTEMARFRCWLSQVGGLAPNTVRTHCRKAKHFFAAAVEQGFLKENPCHLLRDLVEQRNEERERFMTAGESRRVWAACPNAEWRLIFALARFGGLRSSEILRAQWADVRPEQQFLFVRGSKGRYGSGPRGREIPLFPEIVAAIEGLRAERPVASGRIVESYSDSSAMGVLMGRIIRQAGLADWVRPFQNLRSTRSTELIRNGTPIHNYTRWLGHSIQVALRHYAQTLPEDAQRAALLETMPLTGPPEPPLSAA